MKRSCSKGSGSGPKITKFFTSAASSTSSKRATADGDGDNACTRTPVTPGSGKLRFGDTCNLKTLC